MTNFYELRRKVGTQAEVADLLDTTQQAVGKYENGKAYPRRQTLRKIAQLFGVTEGEVLQAIDNSKIEDYKEV